MLQVGCLVLLKALSINFKANEFTRYSIVPPLIRFKDGYTLELKLLSLDLVLDEITFVKSSSYCFVCWSFVIASYNLLTSIEKVIHRMSFPYSHLHTEGTTPRPRKTGADPPRDDNAFRLDIFNNTFQHQLSDYFIHH